VLVVCDESLRYLNMSIDGLPGDHSRLWQRGSNAARLMMEHGYKIVGIAEQDGGLSIPTASTFTN